MQVIHSQPVYSATDLVGFLACEHLAHLEFAAAAGLAERPVRADPELDLLLMRGLEHERRFLEELRAKGLQITDFSRDDTEKVAWLPLPEEAARTAAALNRGDPVIYQGTLFDGRWLGRPDFLIRVDTPSALGAWSYEVYDTKLARKTEAKALLQLCLYSDLLAALQGTSPKFMHVALGGSAHAVESYPIADYGAYYRLVKRQFEEWGANHEPTFPPPTRPDPVGHCEVCRWEVDCQRARRKADDLCLVAGISARQRVGLREKDVETRKGLAVLPVPFPWAFDGSSVESLIKVREQARLQVEGELAGHVLYELLDPKRREDGMLQPGLGLLSLPKPSPGDLFFDMEGDPFGFEDGFDYLFGVIEPGLADSDGQPAFHAFWARDENGVISLAGEKRAFEMTIDLFMDRLERDPGLHIYHYAPYETTAVGRLMGRYATRESEVDRLLRGGVFVDLLRAVRQGVRASVESYSIKRLEPLYGFERTVALRDAGSSIVTFNAWLQDGGENGGDPALLERIEGYNGDDCKSNWKLRDWLEGRREELTAKLHEPLPRPTAGHAAPGETLTAALESVRRIEEQLTADVPPDVTLRSEPQQARWLLAQLLSWHRREDMSGWWRFFHLVDDLTDEERIEEPEPLGGLSYLGVVRTVGRSEVHRYGFPPQEHEIKVGTGVKDPETKKAPGTVADLDAAAGTVDIQRNRSSTAPHPTALVPDLVYPADAQRESLLRIGEWVAENGVEGPGPYRSARELLLRCPPRVGQPKDTALAETQDAAEAAKQLVLQLDGSCLAIQGPPGSGKSTTAAEMIVNLVAAGKRIGVTANSHKVIGNLLDKVNEAAARRHVPVRLGQKPRSGEPCTCAAARIYDDNAVFRAGLLRREIDVAGGTTWAWARQDFANCVDVLFVDEAGQMSLANVIAASQAATSLVLLGDPQQLDQPVKGSHPPGAERSALAHLLGGHATMPPELGLFLERTWRLHPKICAFTSEAFYDGRLEAEAICESRRVLGEGGLSGTGLRFLPIAHEGNAKSSSEEANAVAGLLRELVQSGATWLDDKGVAQALTLDKVLIITPYNAQVRAIATALPGAHVGTVDKFQGQEAPIAVYSMASSSAEDAPRGMEFLYSLNRLNVATSRAQCVALLVASPELLRAQCQTPRQMRLANALCRLVELSTLPKTTASLTSPSRADCWGHRTGSPRGATP